MSSVTSWIGRGLARWVRVVLRFRVAVIVLSIGAAALCVQFAATRLGIDTDTADMISPDLPWRQHFIDYRQTFESRDRNLVVVVEAASAERADAFAAELSERLEQRQDLFLSVFDPAGGEFFERQGLLYLSVDELEDLADRLAGAQPLIGLLRPTFNGATVVDVVRRTVGDAAADADTAPGDDGAGAAADERALASGAGAGTADAPVAAALYRELAAALDASVEAGRDPIAWRALMTGSADEQGAERRLILLRPKLDFDRVQPAAEAVQFLRATTDELTGGEFRDVAASLTGSVAMEYEEMLTVRRGAGVAGLASLLMVGIVLYAALRSFRLLAISLVTLLVGLMGTAAFAAGAVGHLNLLSVAFAVLYIGLGVDFILHVCLRFKELLADGATVDDAVTDTIAGVGTSLVICAATTAAGFFAFIPTEFQGVSELGLISGTGMFLSLAVSVTLLPALLATFTRNRKSLLRPPWIGTRSLARLTAQPKAVLSVTAVVVVAAAALLPQLEFDNNPINLRDPETESVRALAALAAGSEAPLFDLVAVAPDRATALEWARALRPLPTVRSVTTVEDLVPSEQDEKLFVLEDIALLMGPGFSDVERAAPDAEALEGALTGLLDALRRQNPSSEAAAALEASLERVLDELAGANETRRRGVLDALDADIVGALPRELERLELALQAEPFGLDALPDALAERWMGENGRELIEITPAEDVSDNAASERFVDSVRDVIPTATGLPVVYQEASSTVVRSFRLALTYALIMVTILLFVFLRRGADVLLVIVPILLAAGVTAGAAVAFGVPFNFANIIALPLLVGIGVDNGIHIVHRMRTAPPSHGTPYGTSTSAAMLASTLTTIASFGNLGFAAHRGMASMGQLLTIGMVVTLAATLILLPVMLRVWSQR
ncbi:MAG: MMPL family transporter [Gammaproteobacteria bacterium]|nr:MMPL family transporter [Gammaproteobacteria bacterium]